MRENYVLSRTKRFMNKKSWFTIVALFLMAIGVNAQVTTNSGSGLAPTYPDLAAAVTALNAASITSPVIITLDAGNPQTVPSGGYLVTAQGSAVNTITIQGSGNTVTASNALTAGVLNDAIFKLQGADYVTIQNFVMQENAANTTTTAASNNMTEWGVAILYATTTNGAQNNTIQNNTITLNRTYQNTFGIYSNSTHALGTPLTSATATTAAGGNHNLKVYTNAISNVNNGIVVVGPTAVADQNVGIDIGGTSSATGNTITNYGTTGTFSAYANVSGSTNGILVRNSNGTNISYNTITSSVGGVTAGVLNGIQVPASTNAPTGLTFTNVINNNTISLQSGLATGAINGINYLGTTASASSTLNINNNNFTNFGHTVAASGAIVFITTSSTNQFTTINNNTFTNISVNTTGSVTFIVQSFTAPSNGTKTVNNNAIVTGFTKTGAGGTVLLISDNGSTVSGAVSNCQNNNFSNISLTGATTLTGLNYTDGGTAPTRTVSGNILSNWTGGTNAIVAMNFTYWNGASSLTNNTITNITGQSTVTGVNIGSTVSTATAININGNIINNLTSTGTGAAVVGITCANTSSGINIFNNGIDTLSSTGASPVSGIVISGASASGTNVFKNKIYNLSGSNASSTVNGILISGGALVTAYNNIIGDLRTPIANAANPLNGVNVNGGTTVNLYNNTVMIEGTSTGALFGSSAVSVSTTPTVVLRNNIFVNNTTPVGAAGFAVAYRRSSTTLTTYDATSNNNLFFAGVPGSNNLILYDGTNAYQTLATFKTAVGSRDVLSVSENPTFVSTTGANATFLHINTTTPTQIESGAASIAIVTDDFDGDSRNATTPDIGADEFTGNILDLIAPIVNYTPLGYTCDGTVDRILIASITDGTGVPTSGIGLPVLYWRINAGAWNSATGTHVSGSNYSFSFGNGAVLNDVVSYYIVAQDNVATPNVGAFPSSGATGFTSNPPAVTTAPTTPSSYTINGAIGGTYTVGVSGVYPTLTAAVAAYNVSCITGPVTFSLIDATYPSETFPITINQNIFANAGNTLTIKPATGVTATISGSNAGAILLLNGADYVTIDGSNGSTLNTLCPVSSATRDLTINNTNTGTTSGVVWLATASGGNSVLNCTVQNCIIAGNSSTTTIVGLGAGGSTIGNGGTSNNNIAFVNNDIRACQFGIYSAGLNATTKNQNLTINQNVINSVGAQSVSQSGIYVAYTNNVTVSRNLIDNIVNIVTAQDPIGINVGFGAVNGVSTTTTGIADGVSNVTINNNTIGVVTNNSTYSAGGIVLGNTISGTSLIANNMIYGVASNGTSGDYSSGIILGGGTALVNVYHNTVLMQGTIPGGTAATQASSCLSVTSSSAANIDLKNNIFVNTQAGNAGATLKLQAIGLGYTSTAGNYAGLLSNNNLLYSAGAGPGTYTIGTTNGIALGTNRLSLADWQTETGRDGSSLNTNPVFTSATNLHLVDNNPANAALASGGTTSSVTIDFDCESRNGTNPTIGFDEIIFLKVNTFDKDSFKVYPNPVTDTLNIEYTVDVTNISIFNMLGQQVLAKKVNATSTQINMSDLLAGTYLVKVESGSISKTIKVVKK